MVAPEFKPELGQVQRRPFHRSDCRLPNNPCLSADQNSSMPFPEPLCWLFSLPSTNTQFGENRVKRMPLSLPGVCPALTHAERSAPYLGLLLLCGIHNGGAAHLCQLTTLAIE